MSASTRFGGHFVQGHVDCTVDLVQRQPDPPNSLLLTFRVPPPSDAFCAGMDFINFIVPKGYVCLDGTSLTVVTVNRAARTFTVCCHLHFGYFLTSKLGPPVFYWNRLCERICTPSKQQNVHCGL